MPRKITLSLPEPHPGQQQVWDHAGRFNVLECGRRWGKTTFGEMTAMIPAIEGKPTAWFCPTYKLLQPVWEDCKKILAPILVKSNQTDMRLELSTGGSLDFWTMEGVDPGRGRRYKRVVIDEAGIARNLQECWQAAIRPTLTDYRGDAYFLGTPKGSNYFHQLFTRGQNKAEGWASWRLPTTSNPHMPADEIEAARRELPEAVFAQEYLGIPADDGGNPFGLAAIARCVGPLSGREPVIFGVDLAKSHDWTAVVGIDSEGCVAMVERWQRDWGWTRQNLIKIIGGTPALIDSTGVGDPVVEDIMRYCPMVHGFKFSSTSKQQIMEGLASAINTQAVRFPDGWLVRELESYEYEYRAGGRVVYQAPQGLTDDGVCALALAVSAAGTLRRTKLDFRIGDMSSTADIDEDERGWN